jgi:hypothetical protein
VHGVGHEIVFAPAPTPIDGAPYCGFHCAMLVGGVWSKSVNEPKEPSCGFTNELERIAGWFGVYLVGHLKRELTPMAHCDCRHVYPL